MRPCFKITYFGFLSFFTSSGCGIIGLGVLEEVDAFVLDFFGFLISFLMLLSPMVFPILLNNNFLF